MFTYVIYSHKKKKEFLKSLKEKRRVLNKSNEEILKDLEDCSGEAIYFRYLVSLSSKFEIKNFLITKSDLKNFYSKGNTMFRKSKEMENIL